MTPTGRTCGSERLTSGKKKADEVSYYWDRLIGHYTGPNGELLDNPGPDFHHFEMGAADNGPRNPS